MLTVNGQSEIEILHNSITAKGHPDYAILVRLLCHLTTPHILEKISHEYQQAHRVSLPYALDHFVTRQV